MRALKQFLKLKKGYCERQDCRCLTINMWRDYEGLPEVCNCGEKKNSSNSITPTPAPVAPTEPDNGNANPDSVEPDIITLDELNS